MAGDDVSNGEPADRSESGKGLEPGSSREPAKPSSEAPNGSGPASAARAREAIEHPQCDLCGSPMIERHCKLICTQCGYLRDCSDP